MINDRYYNKAASKHGLCSRIAKQTNDENKLSMYVYGKVVPIHNIFGTLNKIYAFLVASS